MLRSVASGVSSRLSRRLFSVSKPSSFARCFSSSESSTPASVHPALPAELKENKLVDRLLSMTPQDLQASGGVRELMHGVSSTEIAQLLVSLPPQAIDDLYEKMRLMLRDELPKVDIVKLMGAEIPELREMGSSGVTGPITRPEFAEDEFAALDSEDGDDADPFADSRLDMEAFRREMAALPKEKIQPPRSVNAEEAAEIYRLRKSDPKKWTTRALSSHFGLNQQTVKGVLYVSEVEELRTKGQPIHYRINDWCQESRTRAVVMKGPFKSQSEHISPNFEFLKHEENYQNIVKQQRLKKVLLSRKDREADPVKLASELDAHEIVDRRFKVVEQIQPKAEDVAQSGRSRFVFVEMGGKGKPLDQRTVLIRETDGVLRTATPTEQSKLSRKHR